MKMRKVVSLPTSIDTLMRPSIAVTMPWELERRIPVSTLISLVVKKGLNKQPLEVLRRNPHSRIPHETTTWPSSASA
jgi:hypothetical protein